MEKWLPRLGAITASQAAGSRVLVAIGNAEESHGAKRVAGTIGLLEVPPVQDRSALAGDDVNFARLLVGSSVEIRARLTRLVIARLPQLGVARTSSDFRPPSEAAVIALCSLLEADEQGARVWADCSNKLQQTGPADALVLALLFGDECLHHAALERRESGISDLLELAQWMAKSRSAPVESGPPPNSNLAREAMQVKWLRGFRRRSARETGKVLGAAGRGMPDWALEVQHDDVPGLIAMSCERVLSWRGAFEKFAGVSGGAAEVAEEFARSLERLGWRRFSRWIRQELRPAD